jgi:hypothetical protein
VLGAGVAGARLDARIARLRSRVAAPRDGTRTRGVTTALRRHPTHTSDGGSDASCKDYRSGADSVHAASLTGEPVTQVTHIPAARVAAAFAKGEPLLETESYKVHASLRQEPGKAEVHLRDTDIIYGKLKRLGTGLNGTARLLARREAPLRRELG